MDEDLKIPDGDGSDVPDPEALCHDDGLMALDGGNCL
jgi:hypothetical protein